MKTVHVCAYCDSADIVQDACVHYNNRDDIFTFDDLYCRGCESQCKTTNEVEVPDDFDIYNDLYKEST